VKTKPLQSQYRLRASPPSLVLPTAHTGKPTPAHQSAMHLSVKNTSDYGNGDTIVDTAATCSAATIRAGRYHWTKMQNSTPKAPWSGCVDIAGDSMGNGWMREEKEERVKRKIEAHQSRPCYRKVAVGRSKREEALHKA